MDDVLARFADFATQLSYRDLPCAVVNASKERLLDTLACAISAHRSEAAEIGRSLAGSAASRTIGGRILGSPEIVAADTAAFATTCLIRDLDLNDDYPGGHPSDALGAVLAVAPTVEASGEQLLTAVVVTYETIIALLRRVPLRDLGWDQSIAISIGAAAGLANLLRLSHEVTRHAISITTVANTALRATRAGQLSMWKGAATAYAVRNAVFAVQLASAGMTGPEAPFTGRHGFAEMVSGPLELPVLGGTESNYRIPDVYTKWWPVAYSLQAVVWAGIELRKQVSPEQLASIEVHTYAFSVSESGSEPAKWDPKTRETADHSIPYVFVRSFLHGTIDHEAFVPESYLDPSIRPLMSMVSVHADEESSRRSAGTSSSCECVPKTIQASRHEVEIINPLGHEKNPVSATQMAARFEGLCAPVLGVARTASALKQWSDIRSATNVKGAFDALNLEKMAKR